MARKERFELAQKKEGLTFEKKQYEKQLEQFRHVKGLLRSARDDCTAKNKEHKLSLMCQKEGKQQVGGERPEISAEFRFVLIESGAPKSVH